MEEQAMPEQQQATQSTQDGKATGEATSGTGDQQPQQITMTSQQLAERLARAKPADYEDLKAKAAKLDEIEQANKSELDKAKDEVEKTKKSAAEATVTAFREAAVKFGGIPQEDADLFLTGTDVETLTKQIERLAGRKKQGPHVAREGTNTNRQTGDEGMREYARNLFHRND